MYGLGNWADISEHVGGRTREECKLHYEKTYLASPDWPEPVSPLLTLLSLSRIKGRRY